MRVKITALAGLRRMPQLSDTEDIWQAFETTLHAAAPP
jgi:hypothetical protein